MAGHFSFESVDASMAEAAAQWAPKRIFDAHAHLFRVADAHLYEDSALAQGGAVHGLDAWEAALRRHMPQLERAEGLFFPFPAVDADRRACNEYILEEAAGRPGSRALLVVAPDDAPQRLAPLLEHPSAAGLKPYHVYAKRPHTFDAPLDEFAPEWMWELADAAGLVLMLHLVRHAALSDPDNLRVLARFCAKYPNAKPVLAHGARGFHGPHTEAGLGALRELDNLWFDASAVVEPLPLLAILNAFGPRRLMFGTDYPISELRGRPVTVGDGFFWMHPETIEADGPPFNMALSGQESLRGIGEAVRLFGLNEADLEDVFWNNARRMLGLDAPEEDLTQRRYAEAKQKIPGGVQLLSKRPEQMAPGQWPAYFREARGCELWDLDGRRWLDMSTSGIGACLLGYRDPHVTAAVQRRVALGSMSTLNPPEEVDLAERLCAIHPWASQTRFARTGGEIGAVAARIARATTGRDLVAVCGYHGWHDWYLAANLGESDALDGHLLPGLQPDGVPKGLRGTTLTFPHNDRGAFERLMAEHGDRLAAVVMEPCRYHDPAPGFLEAVRESTRRAGALLVFDEITIGWRLNYGGAHLRLGVEPDLAYFAKALGNGHPIAAVIGTDAAMDGAHHSFISSTYWTEGVGPAAALATLERFAEADPPEHAARIGRLVQQAWRSGADAHRLPVTVDDGHACLAHFSFDHCRAQALSTLYTQGMLERGILASPSIYPTMAHGQREIDRYAEAIDQVFKELAKIIEEDHIDASLKGPAAHSTFGRLIN
jgi:glutamate-1-semialdehyde 2,1-aminomutase